MIGLPPSPEQLAAFERQGFEATVDALLGRERFGAHIIVGMGETEHDILTLVQRLVDMGGHSHMFCFFPESGSLMDHLPATPRDETMTVVSPPSTFTPRMKPRLLSQSARWPAWV